MENSEVKLDNIIQNIVTHKPKLEDADLLTNTILFKIQQTKEQQKISIVHWIRILTSSASIFLLGLYVFQQSENKFVTFSQSIVFKSETIQINSDCLRTLKSDRSNLLESYSCYLNRNSKKNKHLQSLYQQALN